MVGCGGGSLPQPLRQHQTEAILLDRLRALGRRVYRPYSVVDLRQDVQGVETKVAAAGASTQLIGARYIVGADGMPSLVRERAGIGFAGDAYEQSFVLADVRLRWALDGEEVRLFFSPDGLVVIAPLPGGLHRIVATVDSAPEYPSLADIQQLLDTRGPITSAARIDTIVWSSRFRVHHRLADAYRAGRVLLAGDAAHVHSPAGGQGMNIGIQDALALGNALHAVVRGARDAAALEEYERSCRPIAQRVVELANRLTRVATLSGRQKRALRNFTIRVLDHIPAFRRSLAMDLAELHNR